jgi:hypothetical protein
MQDSAQEEDGSKTIAQQAEVGSAFASPKLPCASLRATSASAGRCNQ